MCIFKYIELSFLPVYVPLVTNKEGVVGPEETGTAFRDYNTMASAKKDYPHDAV